MNFKINEYVFILLKIKKIDQKKKIVLSPMKTSLLLNLVDLSLNLFMYMNKNI